MRFGLCLDWDGIWLMLDRLPGGLLDVLMKGLMMCGFGFKTVFIGCVLWVLSGGFKWACGDLDFIYVRMRKLLGLRISY